MGCVADDNTKTARDDEGRRTVAERQLESPPEVPSLTMLKSNIRAMDCRARRYVGTGQIVDGPEAITASQEEERYV